MHAIGSDHDSVIQRDILSHIIAISCMPDNSKVEDSKCGRMYCSWLEMPKVHVCRYIASLCAFCICNLFN